MIWLLLGVLLWSGVHLVPRLARGPRQQLIERLGEGPYKGVFALAIVSSIVLIVIGWRSTVPSIVYIPPTWAPMVTTLLMVVVFILFGSGKRASNIGRVVRHPQLTGITIWSIAHLLSNGDSRSLLLFGGMGIWAIIEIVLINRDEGEWVKPEPRGWAGEFRAVAISLVIFTVVVFAHTYFAGVSVMGH